MRGEGLAGPLAQRALPIAARHMFLVGESTGTLDDQLETAAMYFDRELDYKLKQFTGLFEPAVILFVGVGRGLRGHRPGVRDVRDLPTGAHLMGGPSRSEPPSPPGRLTLSNVSDETRHRRHLQGRCARCEPTDLSRTTISRKGPNK